MLFECKRRELIIREIDILKKASVEKLQSICFCIVWLPFRFDISLLQLKKYYGRLHSSLDG